jgi:hypothetical protein
VAQPILAQAPTTGPSSGADRRGKAPAQTVTPNEDEEDLDADEEESNDEAHVSMYLNTAMFRTPVRKC